MFGAALKAGKLLLKMNKGVGKFVSTGVKRAKNISLPKKPIPVGQAVSQEVKTTGKTGEIFSAYLKEGSKSTDSGVLRVSRPKKMSSAQIAAQRKARDAEKGYSYCKPEY